MTLEIGEAFDMLGDGLSFEYGKAEDGIYEFTVSAEGMRENIPGVLAAVESAPEIEGWRLIAFRPRNPRFPTLAVRMGDAYVEPDNVWYRIVEAGERVDLVVAIEGLAAENKGSMGQAVFILLDQALGEYDVMTKLRYVDFEALPPGPGRHGLKPLTEIPADFDAIFLEGAQ